MIERGVVKDIKNGKLVIGTTRPPACGNCKACGMGEVVASRIELDNTIGARIGDTVRIELDDPTVLKGAIIFYGFPLAGLALGLTLGYFFAKKIHTTLPSEIISAIAGIIAALAALLAARKHSRINKDRYKPRVLKEPDTTEEALC